MPTSPSAQEVLSREFLELRARLLEVAAALDRIRRAEGSAERDPRTEQIRRALAVLTGDEADQAEQIQRIFSLPYDPEWRAKFAGRGQRAK